MVASSSRCVEKLNADELPFYLNLMAHLARHGIPCPAPMANRHNQFLGVLKDKPACIVSRLDGKSTTAPTRTHCAAMGAMLGQMHIAGMSFLQIMPNPRGGAWRSTTAPQVLPFVNAEQAALLTSEIALHAQQNSLNLPQGLIHADLFRDNVLLEEERIGGLIDFYFACSDALLYDVADHRERLVHAYRRRAGQDKDTNISACLPCRASAAGLRTSCLAADVAPSRAALLAVAPVRPVSATRWRIDTCT